MHALLKRLVTAKDAALPPSLPREAVLTWLAVGARLNWVRAMPGERGISAQVASEVQLGERQGACGAAMGGGGLRSDAVAFSRVGS